MKVNEIISVVSEWREKINQRFRKIEESPELIKESLSFKLETGILTEKEIQSILDTPSCWYTTSYPVTEFTIDDTFTKTIDALSLEELLKYNDGRLELNVTFFYNFYKYDKFNCCTYEIDEEDYEKVKYEMGMCQDQSWREYFDKQCE